MRRLLSVLDVDGLDCNLAVIHELPESAECRARRRGSPRPDRDILRVGGVRRGHPALPRRPGVIDIIGFEWHVARASHVPKAGEQVHRKRRAEQQTGTQPSSF